ncbi:hypothetical protein BDV95DRAFT_665395 [Massariosphaeria phaeospora]|uniref:RRM domain-containing protein n=1 Tax=Massariosphaeria phaeospora TaxID=100035 RepID=A0A7C8ICL3_9PLEO|nr:hypothetical protein BDV95DRAFT_665395 [Massariosphaeria phaeospora]
MAYSTSTGMVYMSNLPHHSEPAYVVKLFCDISDVAESKIKEVLCPRPNFCGKAYVIFETVADAQAAVELYDNEFYGPPGQPRRTHLQLCATPPPPSKIAGWLRLSDYLGEKAAAVTSSTVLVTQLPRNHALRNLQEMFGDIEDTMDWDCAEDAPGVLNYRVVEPGVGLVQFNTPGVAAKAVDMYDGEYWKNCTIYVKCVEDGRMAGWPRSSRRRRSGRPLVGEGTGNQVGSGVLEGSAGGLDVLRSTFVGSDEG